MRVRGTVILPPKGMLLSAPIGAHPWSIIGRSGIAGAVGTSPINLPHSFNGRDDRQVGIEMTFHRPGAIAEVFGLDQLGWEKPLSNHEWSRIFRKSNLHRSRHLCRLLSCLSRSLSPTMRACFLAWLQRFSWRSRRTAAVWSG